MDFRENDAETAFRSEARAWVRDRVAGDPFGPAETTADRTERARWWQDQMAADGWAGLSWPEEYGGRGLTPVHEAIFNQESLRAGAPLPVNFLALIMVAPALLRFGTEEQKRRYLPGIRTAEQVWCIGFSEPGAGSDLASLRTRAEPRNGGWAVDGQKVWTSWAHIADRCLLLARTEPDAPGHRGITCFLAPMAEAQVRPLRMINDDSDFNEVWFSGLRVDGDDVLAGRGEGWKVAIAVLAFERQSVPFVLQLECEQRLRKLVDLIVALGRNDDPVVVERLGDLDAEVKALEVGTMQALSELSQGLPLSDGVLTLKLRWARTMQALTRFGMGLAHEAVGPVDSDLAHDWGRAYLRSRGNSIESGTDEIVLSIIAEQVLGLPRSR